MGRSDRRGCLRLALAALGVAALSSPALAADAVRVLLLESAGPVRVGDLVLRAERDGIRAGEHRVGPVWRAPGRGPHRAADLRVRGGVEVRRGGAGLRVVNRVALEDYVVGTLGREVYATWAPETLKAQAVVTRTYALYQLARRPAGSDFDLEADTSHQVYGGLDAETPGVRAAVESTRGEALVFGGAPILAAFHSASGGRTASAEEVWGESLPYLVSLPVQNEEDSPDTYWRARVSGTTLARALRPLGHSLGVVREARVTDRSASGRALTVVFVGNEGSARVPARALRSALGASVVRSTLFEIRPVEDDFVLVGSGHGHGVGMSQWGAQAMARGGAGYREILETFYPGTALVVEESR